MSREAMQQALEALELLAKWENPSTKWQVRKPKDGGPIVTIYPHKVATDAATLLRERLAQPEQKCAHEIDQNECDWCKPARQEHEPVAWISHSQNLLSWDKFYDDMTPLYTAPQPTQPEQEPVAVVFDPYDAHGLQWLCQHPPHRGDKLYLSPPKREWVGLTDEEINSVRYSRDWTAPWTDTTFARAIEARLKEKNI